jgi:thiamine biosynthesis lipoprotein
MASSAEVLLFGEDSEQLDAIAEMAFTEIARVEQLLSRFDPTSELSRINREAAVSGCLVDFELLQILIECRSWWLRTEGAFDITVGSRDKKGVPLTFDAVELDTTQRHLSFRSSGVRLDLGAYGKGYALDCAARLIRQQGVTSGLLHLGTSSVLAIGSPPDAGAWRIGLRDPDDSTRESQQVALTNAALSTSATRHPLPDQTTVSDLLDPRTGQPLRSLAACTVVAPTASMAEALSTAFVVFGRDRSDELLDEWNDSSLTTIWTQSR